MPVSKTGVGASLPWVRIPPPPLNTDHLKRANPAMHNGDHSHRASPGFLMVDDGLTIIRSLLDPGYTVCAQDGNRVGYACLE